MKKSETNKQFQARLYPPAATVPHRLSTWRALRSCSLAYFLAKKRLHEKGKNLIVSGCMDNNYDFCRTAFKCVWIIYTPFHGSAPTFSGSPPLCQTPLHAPHRHPPRRSSTPQLNAAQERPQSRHRRPSPRRRGTFRRPAAPLDPGRIAYWGENMTKRLQRFQNFPCSRFFCNYWFA